MLDKHAYRMCVYMNRMVPLAPQFEQGKTLSKISAPFLYSLHLWSVRQMLSVDLSNHLLSCLLLQMCPGLCPPLLYPFYSSVQPWPLLGHTLNYPILSHLLFQWKRLHPLCEVRLIRL